MIGLMYSAYVAASTTGPNRDHDGHMADDAVWAWVAGPVAVAVWFALLTLLVWWIASIVDRRTSTMAESPRKDPGTPEEVAAMRFARGEISAEEYRAKLAQLHERHGAGG